MRVYDILQKKISDIQSRLPITIAPKENMVTFQQLLDKESAKVEIDEPTPIRHLTKDLTNSTATPYNAYLSKSQLESYIDYCINKGSNKYGVDKYLIKAIIKQESDFNPSALSSAGAQGLMQLMPGTAELLNVDDSYNIEKNIDGGTRYIKDMLDAFGGDIKLALAAYNAGPSTISKYGGIPPYKETENYVEKVIAYYRQYSGDTSLDNIP